MRLVVLIPSGGALLAHPRIEVLRCETVVVPQRNGKLRFALRSRAAWVKIMQLTLSHGDAEQR